MTQQSLSQLSRLASTLVVDLTHLRVDSSARHEFIGRNAFRRKRLTEGAIAVILVNIAVQLSVELALLVIDEALKWRNEASS